MKKPPAETTNAENLQAKFDRGEDVLDYFDTPNAKVVPPQKRAPAKYLVEHPAGKQSLVSEAAGSYARKGAVTARTQSKNPKTGDYTKRDETPGSPKKGQFMDVKSDGKPFKGVAKEPDKRRK